MKNYLKTVKRLRPETRRVIWTLWKKIRSCDFEGLQIKKLQGFANYYAARTGKVRIVYTKSNNVCEIIEIAYRKDIYRKLK